MSFIYESNQVEDNLVVATLNDSGINSQCGFTFTVGGNGANTDFTLSKIGISIEKVLSPGDCAVSLYALDGRGTSGKVTGLKRLTTVGTAISTGTITEADVNTEVQMNYVSMSNSVVLEAGKIYFVAFNPTTSDATNYYEFRGETAQNSYTSTLGRVYLVVDGGVGGEDWVEIADDNFCWEVIGSDAGTMATHADVVRKMGTNASTKAKSEAFCVKGILEGEGFVNVATTKNWNTAYATILDANKYILNDIVSSYAAMKGIADDMSGYTNRTEAEDMINLLRDGILRNLSILRIKDKQTYAVKT